MEIHSTKIKDVYIIEPKIWHDERGYFYESYNQKNLNFEGKSYNFVQDNEAKSIKGVLRGLHYQLPPFAQTKLVRVLSGEVLDVIVDIRPESETYGQSLSVILSGTNFKQMLVPHGFAHGYVVLSDVAIFAYKCDNFYNKEAEGSILYNDPSLGIDWILPNDQLIISEKDTNSPILGDHKKFVHG
jgi:dTDP-4-dehydrorhamnose 3,5-epimerase